MRVDDRENAGNVYYAGRARGKVREEGQQEGKSFRELMGEYAERKKAEAAAETEDWRDMTEEAWDKMMDRIDDFIDTHKENLRELKEKQDRAARKAALEADPDMRATAASEAAQAVAACGFEGVSFVHRKVNGIREEERFSP